jgi:cytochrome c1
MNARNVMRKIITISFGILMASALSTWAADGKALYNKDCAKCHGANGKGETRMGKRLNAKDYTDPKVQSELTDEAAVKAIKDGFKDSHDKTLMKPAEGLTDADVKALVAYMRSFKK